MHALVLWLTSFPKISVAAVNGLAYGGGLELTMACTLRMAAPHARFALPEAKVLKALPGYGGTQLLPRLVGRAIALEMLLTGDPITAQRTVDIGLINGISDDCLAAAIDLATRASIAGPRTIRLIRNVVDDGLNLNLEAALRLEAEAVAKVAGSPETSAAIAAFSSQGPASVS